MKSIRLTIAAAVTAVLLLACQPPTNTKNSSTPPASLNLSQPGKVLQQIALATGTLPATANGGRSAANPSAGRAVFDPSEDGTVIQGSRLVLARANAAVNIAEIFLTGLKTSTAATADTLTVGEVVSVGAITLVMAGSEMPIADAGRLTTKLSSDGSELQYFWNLGPQLGATGDIWVVLNVFSDGTLELYTKMSDDSYSKATSSPEGLFRYAQYSDEDISAVVTDTRETGTLRSASLNTTFKTIVSATASNAAVLTLQDLSGSPWYAFEAYDDDGSLLATAGGNKTSEGVELGGQHYSRSNSYLLKALAPADGYSWAREEDGSWYTWPNGAPSMAWSGGTVDESGDKDAVELPYYHLWLENPTSDPDVFDEGDVDLVGLSSETELSYNETDSQYQGALVQSLSEQGIEDTGHLQVSASAESTLSAAWSRVVADLDEMSSFSGSEFLADLAGVMTEATPLMPSLDD